MPFALTHAPAAPRAGDAIDFQLQITAPDAVAGAVYAIRCRTPAAGIVFTTGRATVPAGHAAGADATLAFRADAGFPAAGAYQVVVTNAARRQVAVDDITVAAAAAARRRRAALPRAAGAGAGAGGAAVLRGAAARARAAGGGGPTMIPVNVPVTVTPPTPITLTVTATPTPTPTPTPPAGIHWTRWAIPLAMLVLVALICLLLWGIFSAFQQGTSGAGAGNGTTTVPITQPGGQVNTGGVSVQQNACTSNCSTGEVHINTPNPAPGPAPSAPPAPPKGGAGNPP